MAFCGSMSVSRSKARAKRRTGADRKVKPTITSAKVVLYSVFVVCLSASSCHALTFLAYLKMMMITQKVVDEFFEGWERVTSKS